MLSSNGIIRPAWLSLPTYIDFRCLTTGHFIAFASLLGRYIIDRFEYNAIFLISLFFILAGLFVIITKIKENRIHQ